MYKKYWDIVSWNVNGIRSIASKGFVDWLFQSQVSILGVQEIKAQTNQLSNDLLMPLGYVGFFYPAKKPGYSGTGFYINSKLKMPRIEYGFGQAQYSPFDDEGRVMTAHFDDVAVVNAYFPNSQRDAERLPFKLAFCDAMQSHMKALERTYKSVLLMGDYNIAHQEIDLKNPQSNQNNAGFLPQERAWFTQYLNTGYIDTFRYKYPGLRDQYSWWSYRPGIRERNIGWRIDYVTVNSESVNKVTDAYIWPQVVGSDHCPVGVRWKREE